MSAPRTAAGKSYRTGQYGAALVAGTAGLFGACAYAGGGWHAIQWVALAVVLAAVGMIVFLQRTIDATEAAYAEQPRPPIVARPVGSAKSATVPSRRLAAGPDHRTGQPAEARREAAL